MFILLRLNCRWKATICLMNGILSTLLSVYCSTKREKKIVYWMWNPGYSVCWLRAQVIIIDFLLNVKTWILYIPYFLVCCSFCASSLMFLLVVFFFFFSFFLNSNVYVLPTFYVVGWLHVKSKRIFVWNGIKRKK